jgi:acetolactate synthase-1/2/3 large subunit
VRAVAELLEAPVFSYRRGRGVMPSSHRLAASMPLGHRLWAEADVVLGVGTRMLFPLADWGVDAQLKIVRVDIDPEEPERLRKPAAALIGDAGATLSALLERLPRHNGARPSRAAEIEGHRGAVDEQVAKLEPQLSFLKAIRAALPPEGIFVDEVTQIGFVSRLAYPVETPRTYLSPGYQDNLGWGYGTALGAKAARPDLPVVAISGDGGLMYQIGELATAVHHRLAVVAVVFDNSAFGNVKRIQQERFGNRIIAADLTNPDFFKLAESFGVAAFRAKTAPELESALRKALALDAPALIHVPCGEMPSPWDLIHMPRVRG